MCFVRTFVDILLEKKSFIELVVSSVWSEPVDKLATHKFSSICNRSIHLVHCLLNSPEVM